MLNRRIFVGATIGFLPGSACAQQVSDDYVQVYYYDWNVVTRVPLTVEAVRARYHASYLIRGVEFVDRFVARLELGRLTDIEEMPSVIDYRLVIDVRRGDAPVQTYACDAFRLYLLGRNIGMPIDREFKDRFRLF